MLTVESLSKSYDALRVLDRVSFAISNGQLIGLVGPSGCGKTTLLNVLAGLDHANSGRADVEGEGSIGYMMQDSLLLPWRTLAENALLGLEVASGKTVINRKLVNKCLTAFDLTEASNIYPENASGGMKQRVALARTLLTMPSVLLLDEPFSSLDFDVKLKVQRYLLDYQRSAGTTILLVTHDIEDAIALSDEVIVLSSRPARVKAVIAIDLGTQKRDPIEARKSPRFTEFFSRIWDEIKYLTDE
jgi:NitT/TauT family transport system ATP-binding protein